MVRKRDRFWEYAEDLKGRFICKFCNKEYCGGVARVKSHLSRQEGRDIAICPRVPYDVQVSALSVIRVNENSNKRSKVISSSHVGGGEVDSSFDAHDSISGLHQAIVPEMCHKKDKEVVDKALFKAFLMDNILFNVIQDPFFIEFCRSLSNYGVGYSVPSYSTLHTKLVQNIKVEVDDYVSKVKESWTQTGSGCTLMFDFENFDFVDIIAYSPKGAIFLNRFKGSKFCFGDFLVAVIDAIGAENVVQVIIVEELLIKYDLLNERVRVKYPHIYTTHCVAKEIDYLLYIIEERVDWVGNVFDNAKDIVDYMYSYDSVLTLLKMITGDKYLKKPCRHTFTFVSNFLMLQSILEVEDELRQMVASLEWRSMEYYTDEMTQKITNIIQRTTFWSDVKEVIFALDPLIRVFRLVDGEGLTAGYLYEAMERAREALKHRYDNDQARSVVVTKWWTNFDGSKDCYSYLESAM